MVELADTLGLGPSAARRRGSTPLGGIVKKEPASLLARIYYASIEFYSHLARLAREGIKG